MTLDYSTLLWGLSNSMLSQGLCNMTVMLLRQSLEIPTEQPADSRWLKRSDLAGALFVSARFSEAVAE
jgi:hypothetical protein